MAQRNKRISIKKVESAGVHPHGKYWSSGQSTGRRSTNWHSNPTHPGFCAHKMGRPQYCTTQARPLWRREIQDVGSSRNPPLSYPTPSTPSGGSTFMLWIADQIASIATSLPKEMATEGQESESKYDSGPISSDDHNHIFLENIRSTTIGRNQPTQQQ